MARQITLKEAQELVEFQRGCFGGWVVCAVNTTVYGDVLGSVHGNILYDVGGTIDGRGWEFIETPKDRLQRLIDGASEAELLKLINQMEDTDDTPTD